ncbi:TPA: hypothetical protein ACVOY6_002885, partial [Vibrio alginolyticus]
ARLSLPKHFATGNPSALNQQEMVDLTGIRLRDHILLIRSCTSQLKNWLAHFVLHLDFSCIPPTYWRVPKSKLIWKNTFQQKASPC